MTSKDSPAEQQSDARDTEASGALSETTELPLTEAGAARGNPDVCASADNSKVQTAPTCTSFTERLRKEILTRDEAQKEALENLEQAMMLAAASVWANPLKPGRMSENRRRMPYQTPWKPTGVHALILISVPTLSCMLADNACRPSTFL
jgi:hypothetical protein